MQIQVTCTPEDLYPARAFQRVARKGVVILRVYGIVFAAVGIVGIVRAFGGPSDGADFSIDWGAYLIAAVVLGVGVGFFVLPVRLHRTNRREIASAVRMSGEGPAVVTLSDEGFSLVTTNRNSSVRWAGVEKITDLDEWWVFYLTRRTLVVLPKVLLPPQQQAEFGNFVAWFQGVRSPGVPARPAAPRGR